MLLSFWIFFRSEELNDPISFIIVCFDKFLLFTIMQTFCFCQPKMPKLFMNLLGAAAC